MSKTPVQSEQLRVEQVPVKLIQPSPTNPRKHFDQAALAELAESIKAVGVQVPLQLRILISERGGPVVAYEIVGGERRWRAAQIAGLTSVPAIARVMSDAECRESQLIENLQRADLTPMEEAQGYELLIREAEAEGFAITDAQLAAKVGKPVGQVRSRRKLLDLIAVARTAVAEGFITFGCALLVAKLQPDEQEKATHYSLASDGETAAVALQNARALREHDRKFRAEAEAKGQQLEAYELDDEFTPLDERELRGWIESHVLLDLAKAPWPLDTPIEGVDAPACVDCPKRSGSDQALFAELTAKSDVCTDPVCYAAKRQAFVQIMQQQAKDSGAPLLKLSTKEGYAPVSADEQKVYRKGQWLQAEAGTCPAVRSGITDDGQVIDVCVDQACKKHKHQVVAKTLANSAPKTDWEAERKKREQSEADYVVKETPIRMAVRAAILPKLEGAKLLRAVAQRLLNHGGHYDLLVKLRSLALKEKSVEGCARAVNEGFAMAKDGELEGWIVDALMVPNLLPNAYWRGQPKRDREDLWALGKQAGVDCDAIAKQVSKTPKVATKPAKKAAAKKPAKPAAKKKAVRR